MNNSELNKNRLFAVISNTALIALCCFLAAVVAGGFLLFRARLNMVTFKERFLFSTAEGDGYSRFTAPQGKHFFFLVAPPPRIDPKANAIAGTLVLEDLDGQVILSNSFNGASLTKSSWLDHQGLSGYIVNFQTNAQPTLIPGREYVVRLTSTNFDGGSVWTRYAVRIGDLVDSR